MRRGENKRGLSPIVATVLLIFLVLILAAIVFLWARGFFSEQLEKNGEAVENQCRDVNFKAQKSALAGGGRLLEIEISNQGDINLYGISLKEIKGGNEEAHLFVINLGGGAATRIEFSLENADAEEIMIYPVLLGQVVNGNDNKKFTCVENPTRIVL